ncbi:Hsp20/alpha crystallin family protein [bacterium]|nr:Hsp20/alpha crystallin family protein [bacterium]
MDENQNLEQTTIKENYHYPVCDRHPFWKSMLAGLLTFLGAFCAFYVVSDWHYKKMMTAPFTKMDRAFKKEMRTVDNMFRAERGFATRAANVIHLEQGNDAYRILIDLRAFDNNENNVKVGSNGNILNINGQSIKKSRKNEQISEFQQSYMFGDNVNLKEMTKETKGHYYIITVPFSEEVDD